MGQVEKIKGKYIVVENEPTNRYHKTLHVPVLVTDNCREAVWTANKNPEYLTPIWVCGERDFYRDEDGKWRSFEL